MTLHATRLKKRQLTITASLLLLLLVAISAQADQIDRCGTSITRSGSYNMASNLVCSDGEDGVDINADNVTLYIGNHLIVSTGTSFSVGLKIAAGRNHVNIFGGSLRSFSIGVLAASSNSFLHIEGVGVTLARTAGFVAEDSRVSTWLDDTEANGVAGFQLSGRGNEITKNRADHNTGDGFLISGSNNHVTHNHSADNGGTGINVTATASAILLSDAAGNATFDLADQNNECDQNLWEANTFGTRNQNCIH